MRRNLLLLASLVAVAATPFAAAAQQEDDARRRAQADAERRKAEKEKQWALPQAELPTVRATGPCPFVKVLYDASRYQEFKGRESAATVGYTGEIEGVRAACQYRSDEPIRVQVTTDFSLGRGPMAEGRAKDFRYWVAVTERNSMVLAKEYFTVRGEFNDGERTRVADRVEGITIPRAAATVSGANFEILVGFDVTPEMADFNRQGKRFRVNATAPVAQAPTAAAPTAQ